MGLAAFNRMRRQKAEAEAKRNTESKSERTAPAPDSAKEPAADKPRRKRAAREA